MMNEANERLAALISTIERLVDMIDVDEETAEQIETIQYLLAIAEDEVKKQR